jgi:hypothetical protein
MPTGLKWYQALTNLSVPIKVPGEEKRTVLVMPGEKVQLDEDTANNLRRNHRTPVIRPIAEGSEPLPMITGRSLTGRIQGPPVDARNDPRGSSALIELKVPELTDPHPGGEQVPPGDAPDALDIAPTGAGRNAAARVAAAAGAGK